MTEKIGLVNGDEIMRRVIGVSHPEGMVFIEKDMYISKNWLERQLGICRVPILPPEKVDARLKRRIEAAIVAFKQANGLQIQETDKHWSSKDVIDLLRYVLSQPQDTWSDSDFGLTDNLETK